MPKWGELQIDQLRYMARTHGEAVAYRDLDAGTAITFTEWDERSNRLARGLAELGIEKGDRVCILMPATECLRWIVAYAAVHKAGAVVVPGNTRLTARELVTILSHAEASMVITCDAFMTLVDEVRLDVPSIANVLSDGGEGAMSADPSEFQVPLTEDDLADIMYTSGTTGLPKGVAVRHRNLAMVPNNEPPWSGESWIHGAPLFTFAGLAFIYNPMKMGLVGLYLPKFDAERWFSIVAKERPLMGFLVPAMAELIVAHPKFEEYDLNSLTMISIGSAPLAPQTLLLLQRRLPQAMVTNSYGMTEAGPAYIVMPKEELEKRPGSVGKPMPPMEMRIVREEGTDCEAREVGELWTRMPGRQREYYKDDGASAATWTPDGWLRSGDLGYLDEDGFLYISGRMKDLIIRGGHNVYPTDIEAVLLEHSDVQEAAVVGIPHTVLGEDIAAVVVLKDGADVDTEELFAFCRERLADYKCPRRIDLVDDLPRNATGKVMKHVLREQLA